MKILGYRLPTDEWSASNVYNGKCDKVYTTDGGDVIDPNAWEHIGWILPGDAAVQGIGKIYKSRDEAGTNSVAAFIKRSQPAAPIDPMNVTRSEFENLHKRIDNMIATQNALIERVGVHARSIEELAGRAWEAITTEPPMTFYDHAFIAAWSILGEGYSRADAIKVAHEIAAELTAARRPVKPA